MRTIVAPSRIASSKSSDMPIDKVSTAGWLVRNASGRAHARRRALAQGGIGMRRRNRHQPAQAQARGRSSRVSGGDVLRTATRLARLVVDVDLDEHVRAALPPAGARSTAARAWRDRASAASRNAVRPRTCSTAADDQVPFEPEAGERGLLGQRFLHVVLAERLLAECRHRAQVGGRARLADREHAQQAPPAAASARAVTLRHAASRKSSILLASP